MNGYGLARIFLVGLGLLVVLMFTPWRFWFSLLSSLAMLTVAVRAPAAPGSKVISNVVVPPPAATVAEGEDKKRLEAQAAFYTKELDRRRKDPDAK